MHITSAQLPALDALNSRYDTDWDIGSQQDGALFVNIHIGRLTTLERRIDPDGSIMAFDEGDAFEWVRATVEPFTDADGVRW